MDKTNLRSVYADWLVKNANKKGTEAFNTVATAYKDSLQLLKGDTLNETTNPNLTLPTGSTDVKKTLEQPEVSDVESKGESTKISMLGKLPKFISHANAGEIDSILMPKLKGVESGGRHIDPTTMQLIRSPKGAEGITQVMPATGVDPGYGVAPLKDTSEEEYERFSKDYVVAMLKEFDGDTEKALASYNYGPAALKFLIKKYGDNWKEHLPIETKKYVAKIMGND